MSTVAPAHLFQLLLEENSTGVSFANPCTKAALSNSITWLKITCEGALQASTRQMGRSQSPLPAQQSTVKGHSVFFPPQ